MPVRIVVLSFAISLAASAGHAAAPAVPRPLDDHGDPLPDGAAARLGTLRWRPGVTLSDLAWSPDGKWLASADSYLGTVRLWDAKTGRVVQTFWGQKGGVVWVAFSPDGKRLVSSGGDGAVRVWDVATGRQRLLHAGPSFPYPRAAFSSDGKSITVLATSGRGRGGDSAPVLRYNAESGKELSRIKVEGARSVELSPNGERVAALARNDRAPSGTAKFQVVEAATGRVISTLRDADNSNSAAFSPDGRRIAYRGVRTALMVCNATTGAEILSLSQDEVDSTRSFSFSSDGKRLLAADEKGQMRVWDLATGKRTPAFEGAAVFSRARAFSPDGKVIAAQSTGSYDAHPLRFWDTNKGTLLGGKDAGQVMVKALAFSSDGKHLLAAGHGDSALLWDVKTRKVVRRLTYPNRDPRTPILAVAFSRDGKKAAAVAQDSPVLVWDVGTGKVLHELRVTKKNHYLDVLFSADGATLFAAGNDDAVYRWDLKTGKDLQPLRCGEVSYFRDLTLSKDGKTLTAPSLGVTAVFDVATGKLLRTIKEEGPMGWRACVSPDEKRYVFYTQMGKFALCSAADGKALRRWESGAVLSLSYSPDGKTLLGTSHRLLRLWEEGTGKERPPLVGDVGPIWATAFSADGKWLATAGAAGTILLWDASVIRRPPQHRPSPGEWKALWQAAGGTERDDFAHVQGTLLAGGAGTVARVRQQLFPPAAFGERFARLLDQLADEDATVHNRAKEALVVMGESIVPLIDNALQGALEPYQRQRLRAVRAQLTKDDPEDEGRRAPRVVSVLRQIPTPSADALLAELARGNAGRVWADAAKARK